MARTTLHLPQGLLEQLDEIAKQRGTGRNRLIVDACRGLVEQRRGEGPEGCFADERLSPDDLEELRAGVGEMMDAIRSARRSRSTPPFRRSSWTPAPCRPSCRPTSPPRGTSGGAAPGDAVLTGPVAAENRDGLDEPEAHAAAGGRDGRGLEQRARRRRTRPALCGGQSER